MKIKNIIRASVILLIANVTITTTVFSQQLKVPAPSSTQILDQAFGLSNIKIEYSRPSMKGRVVFGDLVPYDKIWRTGANASTKITFGDTVSIEGKMLPAGTYAIYTIPGKNSWDILFNKDITLAGNVADYKQATEVLRVTVKPMTIAEKIETFTINIGDITPNSGDIELMWENTIVLIKVTADIDGKIMKNIDATVATDSRPYYQAANYYYDNNKDMATALKWANSAVESNPKGFFIFNLKAKIQKRMGDKKGAIESANRSIALAKEAKNDDYVRLNEKLIAEINSGK